MAPLRILVISHSAVVTVNQEPFHALGRDGADVSLVAPRALVTDIRGRVVLAPLPEFAGRLVPLAVAIGGYKAWLGGQRGIHLIVYRGLARAVEHEHPDVIFVEEEPHSLAARQAARIAARRRIPFIVHENQNIARKLPPPFGTIRRRVLARAAGVTVRSDGAKELVRALGFAGPVGSFPHGVDLARFTGGAPSTLPRPVVGFVGRLVPEKGIMELIEAAEGLGASLLVVGDGPLLRQTKARAAALGVRSEFTGALSHEEVPRRYAGMDVVAVPSRTTPSWKEQFGRIVIEANAAGVPVVVSDSGELPRTVEATGGGIIVPEGDHDALRNALKLLCDDPERRRALGEAGCAAVRRSFTPEAIARELHRFLREATS